MVFFIYNVGSPGLGVLYDGVDSAWVTDLEYVLWLDGRQGRSHIIALKVEVCTRNSSQHHYFVYTNYFIIYTYTHFVSLIDILYCLLEIHSVHTFERVCVWADM